MFNPVSALRGAIVGGATFVAGMVQSIPSACSSVASGFMRYVAVPAATHIDAHCRKSWRFFRYFLIDVANSGEGGEAVQSEQPAFEGLHPGGIFASTILFGLVIWPLMFVYQFIYCNLLNVRLGLAEGVLTATAVKDDEDWPDPEHEVGPWSGRVVGCIGRLVGFFAGLFSIGLLFANLKSLVSVAEKVWDGLDRPMYLSCEEHAFQQRMRESVASSTTPPPSAQTRDEEERDTPVFSTENFTWHWLFALPGVIAGAAIGVVFAMLENLWHHLWWGGLTGALLMMGASYKGYLYGIEEGKRIPTWALLPLLPVALAGLLLGSAFGMALQALIALFHSFDYFNAPFQEWSPARPTKSGDDSEKLDDKLEKPKRSWGQWCLHALRTALWYVFVGPLWLAASIPGALVGMAFAMVWNVRYVPWWAGVKAYRSLVAPERGRYFETPPRVIIPMLPLALVGVAIGSSMAFVVLTGLTFFDVRDFFNQPVFNKPAEGRSKSDGEPRSPVRSMSVGRRFEVEHAGSARGGNNADAATPPKPPSRLAAWWSRRRWTELLFPVRLPFYVLGAVLGYVYLAIVNIPYVAVWAFRSAYRDELKQLIELNNPRKATEKSSEAYDVGTEAARLGPFAFMALGTTTSRVSRAVFLPPLFLVALMAWWVGGAVAMIRVASLAARTRFAEWNQWASIAYQTPELARAESEEAVRGVSKDMEAAGNTALAAGVRRGAGISEPAPKPVFPYYTGLSQLLGGFVGVSVALLVNAWRIAYEVFRDTRAVLYTSPYEERGDAIEVTSGSRMVRLYNTRYFPNQVDAKNTFATQRLNASGLMWVLMVVPAVLGVIAGVVWSVDKSIVTGLAFGIGFTSKKLISLKDETQDGHFLGVVRYWLGVQSAVNRSEGFAKWLQVPLVFLFKVPFFFLPALASGLVVSLTFMAISFVVDVLWQLAVAINVGLDMSFLGRLQLPPHYYSSRLSLPWPSSPGLEIDPGEKSYFRQFWRFPGLAAGFVLATAVTTALVAVRLAKDVGLVACLVPFGLLNMLFSTPRVLWALVAGSKVASEPLDQDAKVGPVDLSAHFNFARGFVFDPSKMSVPRSSRWFSWLRGFRDHMMFAEDSIADRTIKAINDIVTEKQAEERPGVVGAKTVNEPKGTLVSIRDVLEQLQIRSKWGAAWWLLSGRALREEEIEAEQVVVAYNNAISGVKADASSPPAYDSVFGHATRLAFWDAPPPSAPPAEAVDSAPPPQYPVGSTA